MTVDLDDITYTRNRAGEWEAHDEYPVGHYLSVALDEIVRLRRLLSPQGVLPL